MDLYEKAQPGRSHSFPKLRIITSIVIRRSVSSSNDLHAQNLWRIIQPEGEGTVAEPPADVHGGCPKTVTAAGKCRQDSLVRREQSASSRKAELPAVSVPGEDQFWMSG